MDYINIMKQVENWISFNEDSVFFLIRERDFQYII